MTERYTAIKVDDVCFLDETDAYGHCKYSIHPVEGVEEEDETMVCADFQWLDREMLFLTSTCNTPSSIDTYRQSVDGVGSRKSNEQIDKSIFNHARDWVYRLSAYFVHNDMPYDNDEVVEIGQKFAADVLAARPPFCAEAISKPDIKALETELEIEVYEGDTLLEKLAIANEAFLRHLSRIDALMGAPCHVQYYPIGQHNFSFKLVLE